MPEPVNQWYVCGSGGATGFGPMRSSRPLSPSGMRPRTGRSATSISSSTGAKLPDRYLLVVTRGSVVVMVAPSVRDREGEQAFMDENVEVDRSERSGQRAL